MKVSARTIILITLIAAGGSYMLFFTGGKSGSGTAARAIKIPALSSQAKKGEVVFNANCAACHGKNAAGTDQGPPLIHNIYNPGHHADMAFYRAANLGTPQHHWRFGDMPPQKQVSKDDVTLIIKYIREVQRANGIVYQKHVM